MKEILNYVKQIVDENATIEKWNAKAYLNLMLAGNYEYYLVNILGEHFLAIKPNEMMSITRLKIQINTIQEKTGYNVALLLEDSTAYLIKKMLGERIAFITVDKQMYLPFLALHIKKQQKKIQSHIRERFTAATQMVFLALLYSEKEEFGVEELSSKLDISSMTVLRAIEELKKIGIVSCHIGGQTGRKKIIRPINKKEYYHIGKDYLINPVKKTMNVSSIPKEVEVYKSGLTALGEQTMLGEPARERYAVYGNMMALSKYQTTKVEALMEDLPEVQVMHYDIGKLTLNQYVDPITLIYSLEESDERIEIAINELMEGNRWYEA